jgi:hypothetical protein
MTTNLRRSPRFINSAVPVAIPDTNANVIIIAAFREKLEDIESTACCDSKLKKIKALFKFALQKECIAFVKNNSRLHTTILNKAKIMRDGKSYINHSGSLENKVALIKTSKKLEKALL